MRRSFLAIPYVLALAGFVACAEPAREPAPPPRVAVVLPTATDAPPPRAAATPEARTEPADRGDAGSAEVAIDPRPSRFDDREPVRVERPPFAETVRTAPPALGVVVPPPRLVKVSETRNQITDHDAWFAHVGKTLPTIQVPNPFMGRPGQLPADLPARYRRAIAIRAIDHGDHLVILYGDNFSSGRYLAVFDAAHHLTSFLDFDEFVMPPAHVPGDAQFVRGGIFWAEERDGVLYVSSGHHTYAKSSLGKNAFLTAIDPTSGHIYWQSAPLVANASDFLVRRGYIVSGYGFTAEPDFLYVVDRATGHTTTKIPVKSGPEVLLEKDGRLYVRTYDTDLVFDLR